jgi:hypothetical protein
MKREDQVMKNKLARMTLKIRGTRKGHSRKPTSTTSMREMKNIQEW